MFASGRDVRDDLSTQGFVFIRGGDRLASKSCGWTEFAEYWHDLSDDKYLPKASGQFRFRRYGQFEATIASSRNIVLTPLPPASFTQSVVDIPLYGGMSRHFAPLTDRAYQSAILRCIIRSDLRLIVAPGSRTITLRIGVHMVRVMAEAGCESNPTPEGRHRDGHDFVAMHLISRSSCIGGESLIYGTRPSAIAQFTMSDSLDTILVNDRLVAHEVRPIRAETFDATRDMLLVDVNHIEVTGSSRLRGG